MTIKYSNPADNPATWSLGYQARQFGVAGPSILAALANPPSDMVTAVATPEYTTGGTAEPQPIYGLSHHNPLVQELKEAEQEDTTTEETDSGESL